MIMAFTLSLDDFVISYFTQGNGFQTLPIRIYNMTKKTVTPKMYALATIIFFVILALLMLTNLVDEDDSKKSPQWLTVKPSLVAHAAHNSHATKAHQSKDKVAKQKIYTATRHIPGHDKAGAEHIDATNQHQQKHHHIDKLAWIIPKF